MELHEQSAAGHRRTGAAPAHDSARPRPVAGRVPAAVDRTNGGHDLLCGAPRHRHLLARHAHGLGRSRQRGCCLDRAPARVSLRLSQSRLRLPLGRAGLCAAHLPRHRCLPLAPRFWQRFALCRHGAIFRYCRNMCLSAHPISQLRAGIRHRAGLLRCRRPLHGCIDARAHDQIGGRGRAGLLGARRVRQARDRHLRFRQTHLLLVRVLSAPRQPARLDILHCRSLPMAGVARLRRIATRRDPRCRPRQRRDTADRACLSRFRRPQPDRSICCSSTGGRVPASPMSTSSPTRSTACLPPTPQQSPSARRLLSHSGSAARPTSAPCRGCGRVRYTPLLSAPCRGWC